MSTPSRFTPQNQTTHDRLSNNVVGLVNLSDFRKRRAEVLEQQEREAREAATATAAAAAAAAAPTATTTASEASDDAKDKPKKKKSKTGKPKPKAAKLSFADDEDDEEDGEAAVTKSTTTSSTHKAPRSFTKQALRRQAAEREALRRQFLALQTAVKATEVAIPFVFYEGAPTPGGVVRVKKGDPVWLFLDRTRKVAARLGVGEKRLSKARQHWARVSVDDLMLVRGTLIIPHHFDFYFFIINKTLGPGGVRVFDYSSEIDPANTDTKTDSQKTEGEEEKEKEKEGKEKEKEKESEKTGQLSLPTPSLPDSALEGYSDDPNLTKVVDRRWYERNKHIYPANVWQEFDPEQDYTRLVRRDQGGNAFFSLTE